jgi:protein-S-isoprenylcysteine O-methyltransferase Ste14
MTDPGVRYLDGRHAEQSLDRRGLQAIAASFVGIFAGFAVLLIAAGEIRWANAWVYIGLVLFYQVTSTMVLVRANPQVLNERARFTREGTMPFDRAFGALYLLVSFTSCVVFGFDAVRYRWSSMPTAFAALGVALILPAFALAIWAMVVNPYFELSVRIQEDRGQKVITGGPYRFIRHPGYASLIVSWLAAPFILGSWWGLLPSGVMVALVVARTALEDRALRDELPGYAEYAVATPYRLLPLAW